MGRLKPLLPLGSRPVIEHCLENLAGGGIEETVVVLGPSGAPIAEMLNEAVITVWNDEPISEMAGSVRLGVRHVAPKATGVLVALADHPLVEAGTIRRLLRVHTRQPQRILIPTFGGKRGHPVLFPREILTEIFTLPTLREVVRRAPERTRQIAVDDAGVVLDMDTPADYRRALDLWEQRLALAEALPVPPRR